MWDVKPVHTHWHIVSYDNCWNPWPRKFIYGMPIHLTWWSFWDLLPAVNCRMVKHWRMKWSWLREWSLTEDTSHRTSWTLQKVIHVQFCDKCWNKSLFVISQPFYVQTSDSACPPPPTLPQPIPQPSTLCPTYERTHAYTQSALWFTLDDLQCSLNWQEKVLESTVIRIRIVKRLIFLHPPPVHDTKQKVTEWCSFD